MVPLVVFLQLRLPRFPLSTINCHHQFWSHVGRVYKHCYYLFTKGKQNTRRSQAELEIGSSSINTGLQSSHDT